MNENSLFNIPYYTIPVLDFEEKKIKLIDLLKRFPEKKHGLQNFSTNKQTNRYGLTNFFTKIIDDELKILSQMVKSSFKITDVWSVSYEKGEDHPPHNHGTAGLSGILYLDLPEDAPVTNYMQPWQDIKCNDSVYYPLPVTEGSIVVVPKFVLHFSPPNSSESKKRIVSWDMEFISEPSLNIPIKWR